MVEVGGGEQVKFSLPQAPQIRSINDKAYNRLSRSLPVGWHYPCTDWIRTFCDHAGCTARVFRGCKVVNNNMPTNTAMAAASEKNTVRITRPGRTLIVMSPKTCLTPLSLERG